LELDCVEIVCDLEFLVVFAGYISGIDDRKIVIEWSKSGYMNFFEFVGDHTAN
jgi:hypothetical protein